MSSTATSTTGGVRASDSPSGGFASVLNAAVGTVAAKLERKVAGWTDKLNGIADGGESSGVLTELADEGLDAVADAGGTAQAAGAEGLKAGLHHKNPLWGAIKGAWEGGSPVVRAAMIAAAASLIVLLVLSPVLLIVFLVSLLILLAVERARADKKQP